MYSMDSMLVHYVNNVCSFSSGLLDRISELSTINLHLIGEWSELTLCVQWEKFMFGHTTYVHVRPPQMCMHHHTLRRKRKKPCLFRSPSIIRGWGEYIH